LAGCRQPGGRPHGPRRLADAGHAPPLRCRAASERVIEAARRFNPGDVI
jgi:hypothetical protein